MDRWRCGAPARRTRSGQPRGPTVSSNPDAAASKSTADRGLGSDPTMLTRPPAGQIPDAPGSYQFKDAQGRVIYVGKASSLRQRLSNYFGDPRLMHPRTAQMVQTAE